MALIDIIALSTIEIFGDFLLRFYAQTDKLQYLYGGILGYAGVLYYLIKSFRSHNVLYVNGMWDGISGVVESAAAFFILGDRLKHPVNYIGLVLIIVGVILLKEH